MSYEYRSGSQSLELPNPYKVENLIRFVVGAVMIAVGIWLLFVARGRLTGGWNLGSAFPLVTGVLLLIYGVTLIATAMRQLRFFFGRDRPAALAPDLPADAYGTSPAAQELQDVVRRGALTFPEPKGALNGALYHAQPNLILAPVPLQRLAQAQFRVALVICAILAALLVSLLLSRDPRVTAWLGALFFVLTVLIVLRPIERGDSVDGGTAVSAVTVSNRFPVMLAVIAVLGPVLLSLIANRLPDISMLHFIGANLCMLIAAGIGATLFFMALRAQLGPTPPATSSMHQAAVSMNCQPAQLVDELERRLQEQWREQIPNRRYIAQRPEINVGHESSGTFASDLFQETQPLPNSQAPPATIGECLEDSERKWVLYLQLFGAALLLAATALAGYRATTLTVETLVAHPSEVFNALLFSVTLWAVGHYCFRAAHELFGRFDFESLLYWFEAKGNYQVASVDYGNVLQDRLKTRKNIINIETATLRLWIVELQSVVFGKDNQRYMRAMIGRKQDAQTLLDSLTAFAAQQSVVVAPTAVQDEQRIAAMTRFGNQAPITATDPIAAGLLLSETREVPPK
jgi:hypothetical protein